MHMYGHCVDHFRLNDREPDRALISHMIAGFSELPGVIIPGAWGVAAW